MTQPAQATEPLNVLVIVTDDQRRSTHRPMPDATWFPNFFDTSPLCCPSRTSIMSGQYAHNHGVLTNVPRNHPFSLGAATLQSKLQSSGYTTGMFGKFLNAWPRDVDPPGFNQFAVLQGGSSPTGSGMYLDSTWNMNSESVTTEGRYSTHVISDKADSFIRSQTGPWYAYVAPYAPHMPAIPSKKYQGTPVSPWNGNPAVPADRLAAGQKVRRRQIRTLRSVYDMRARLVATLRERGELDNTLILYLPDNGYQWGEHNYTAKGVPYDQSVRVGAYVRGAGFNGGTDRRYVANIDVFPTVLKAVGVPYTRADVDGRPLQTSSRSAMLLEYWGNVGSWNPWASIRTPRFMYTEWDTGRREYYRMKTDPWQLHNLLGDGKPGNNPDVKWLHTWLNRASTCEGKACP